MTAITRKIIIMLSGGSICYGVLREFGIEEKRLKLEWISACESDKFVETLRDAVKEIRAIGPLNRKECGHCSKNHLTR